MPAPENDLLKFKVFLHHVGSLLETDISVELWDGNMVPLCGQPTSNLAVRIADPGVIASLLRSPRTLTVASLLASGRLRIVNGTLLELEPRRQEIENKVRVGALRKIDKWLALKALLPFLMLPGKAPIKDQAFQGKSKNTAEKGRDDKAFVQFHYDLSNDFYALFLDPLMIYSCAYFPRWDATLEEAQRAKLDIICRKLRLQPGERFLDIGCGWGGLITHAAQHYGVMAHGTTLSQAQFEFAKARIAALKLEERVTVELADFRTLAGTYDKIASIEMYEHIGAANLEGYFAKVASLLRVRGLFLQQASVRRARRDDAYLKHPWQVAFTKYIFPGGYLDHIGNTIDNLEKHEFDVHDVENWREHFSLTLRKWTARLYGRRHEAEALIGEARTHLWLLYLARSAIGFDRGAMAVIQILASKRVWGASGLPPTRADLYTKKCTAP